MPLILKPTTYATFVGLISQDYASRIVSNINMCTQHGVTELHVLFQSIGGATGDGIALFTYFRACPIDLHFYNGGTIESAAVLAFVGAKHRYTSAHGTFMIHKSTLSTNIPLKADDFVARAKSLHIDDARYEAILRDNTRIPAELFTHYDVTLVASEALDFGVAQSVREFAVPAGDQILDLTFKLG